LQIVRLNNRISHLSSEESEGIGTNGLERRINEMKKQFQDSYDFFMKAHDKLSQISFTNLKFDVEDSGQLDGLAEGGVSDILKGKSLDECLENFNAKVKLREVKIKKAPELKDFFKIISDLHSEMKSLDDHQTLMSRLSKDLDDKIDNFNWETTEIIKKVEDLSQIQVPSDSESDSDDYSGSLNLDSTEDENEQEKAQKCLEN
jgi:hypothetical protein